MVFLTFDVDEYLIVAIGRLQNEICGLINQNENKKSQQTLN